MDSIVLDHDLLGRLLSPEDPALRARVLTDLLDRPDHDRDVVAARERIPQQSWVKATLAAHNGDGTWGRGFYSKYDGTSWALLHLTEVGVPMDLAPIRAGVRRLIETARPVERISGALAVPFCGLRHGVYWHYPMACLTAHMALVLIRAGLPDHPTTQAALNLCRHRFQPGLGFGCSVMDDSLLPACVMTVPKVLKAFVALAPAHRTAEDQALIDAMVEVLKRFRLYQYVARDAGEWRVFAPTVPPQQRREAKQRWLAEGRADPRRPKEGWLRLSFPLSYNSDLLEVLLLLGEAGASDLGRAGQPSPWITYRALLAFKRFGSLELPSG